MVSGAAFGLIDDQFLFDPALENGHWRLFWGDPSGRFYPLCGREFLVLRQLGVLSAPVFYSIQSAKFLAAAGLARAILLRAETSPRAAFVICLAVFGSPAFLVSVSRLFVAELTPFVLFLAGLYLLGRPDGARGWRAWLGLALTGTALFHKETGFLATGCMGLVLTFRPGAAGRSGRATGVRLMAISILFFGCYLAFGHAYMQEGGYTASRTLDVLSTAVFFLRNDPPLALMLAACLASLALGRNGRPFPAFEAACLAGALAYTGAFLILRITSPWYLLPAYAFVLPCLPVAVSRLAAPLPATARTAAVPLALAAAVLWSTAGYSFLDFNQFAARAYQDFWTFLETRGQPSGDRIERLNLPRVYPATEPAQNLRAFLRFKGLQERYAPACDGLEDIWRTIADAPGLAVFLPHTRLDPLEAALLASCRPTLLETKPLSALPAALADCLGLSAPDGTSRDGASPTGVCRVFGPEESPTDRPRCPRGFAWEGLSASTAVSGVKVCPMTGGRLPVRLTNSTERAFVRTQADPSGHLGVVLFAAVPGEPARAIGFHPLPERLEPGDSVNIQVPFSVFTYQPTAIGVTVGSVSGGDVHPAVAKPLLASNFLPRFRVCWNAAAVSLASDTPETIACLPDGS